MSRRLHATQTGGCGFWRGFGNTFRGGMVTNLPGVARERRLGEAAQRDPQALLPHRALLGRIDEEAAELGFGRRLAASRSRPAARDEIERGDALGDARRMVESRRRLHDAVPEPHVLGALRDRGEEHLGRARMAVLLEEVVLDLPDRVDAERVRERALLERVLEERVLRVLVPGPRELVLVEESEAHARVVGAARALNQDARLRFAVMRRSSSRANAGRPSRRPYQACRPGCAAPRPCPKTGRERDRHEVADVGDAQLAAEEGLLAELALEPVVVRRDRPLGVRDHRFVAPVAVGLVEDLADQVPDRREQDLVGGGLQHAAARPRGRDRADRAAASGCRSSRYSKMMVES